MYDSNKRARIFLLSNGVSDVWFKRHTRRKDLVHTKNGPYPATDLFNLFDGVALSEHKVIFFQVKTGTWPAPKPMTEFARRYAGVTVLALNVRKKNGKYEVARRVY